MEGSERLTEPQGTLKEHVLVDGILYRVCMGCRIRPVPRGLCCILLCGECLRERGAERDRRGAEMRRRFNELRESGMSVEDAAEAVGVNRWTGALWAGTLSWEEIAATAQGQLPEDTHSNPGN